MNNEFINPLITADIASKLALTVAAKIFDPAELDELLEAFRKEIIPRGIDDPIITEQAEKQFSKLRAAILKTSEAFHEKEPK